MQIVLQLDPDVLIEAQKLGVSTDKKLLLTKSTLKEHPSIQKSLIPRQEINTKTGEVLVNQKLQRL